MYFGTSAETSDFVIDCLSRWWQENNSDYLEIEELAINLHNGIGQRSNRSQFIKRIVQFSWKTQLRIRLIYSSYLNDEVLSFRFGESGAKSQETMPN